MSRLESAIRRLTAQKEALDWAANMICGKKGIILELGLGNGRTYDHLRKILPEREIFVFERKVAAHPDCIPDNAHLFHGDFYDCLPRAFFQLGAKAVLAHLDIGTGIKADSERLASGIAPLILDLMRPEAIIISDQEIAEWKHIRLILPNNIRKSRIYLYQVTNSVSESGEKFSASPIC